jgi:hypothetical protein
VKLSSFGSFVVRKKGQRLGRNPKTGTQVPIAPTLRANDIQSADSFDHFIGGQEGDCKKTLCLAEVRCAIRGLFYSNI